jgi:hypothetical protein
MKVSGHCSEMSPVPQRLLKNSARGARVELAFRPASKPFIFVIRSRLQPAAYASQRVFQQPAEGFASFFRP